MGRTNCRNGYKVFLFHKQDTVPQVNMCPGDNTGICWAAAATMMLSWRDQTSYEIHDAMKILMLQNICRMKDYILTKKTALEMYGIIDVT